MNMANATQFAVYKQKTGNVLRGVPLSPNALIGVATLNQLEQYGLIRPTKVESATQKQMKGDKHLSDAHDIREQVQRRFDKARNARAEAYSYYIDGIANGTLYGAVPPITLFCPVEGFVSESGVMLPYGSMIINLDGETQTEARFIRRDRDPDTGDELVSFVIFHGIPPLHAGNIMHDFNHYAHPVAEKVVASLNSNGSVTRAVLSAMNVSGVLPDEINRHNGNVKTKHVTSFNRLLAAAIGYATGVNALQRGALSRLIGQYNGGGKAIDEKAPQAFLVRALGLARGNKLIAKAPEQVWALVGAWEARTGKVITKESFEAAANAYAATKGSMNSNLKMAAAAKSINFGEL